MTIFPTICLVLLVGYIIDEFKSDIKKEVKEELKKDEQLKWVTPPQMMCVDIDELKEDQINTRQNDAEFNFKTYQLLEAEAKGHDLAAAVAKEKELEAYKSFRTNAAKEARAQWIRAKKRAEETRALARDILS